MTFHLSKIISNKLVQHDCLFLSLRGWVEQKWQKETMAPFFREVTSGARHTDCLNMWSIEWNEFREQVARCSCLAYWWLGLGHSYLGLKLLVCRMTMPEMQPSPPRVPGHSAGYLYTAGSRSPGYAKGSGRAAAGRPLSHTAPARCGRCTEYRSLCSTSLLPQSTLLQGRGKWKGCWALASAPRSHLGGGHKIKTLEVIPRQSHQLLKNRVLWRTEKMNWPWSTSLCSYQQNSEEKISCVEIRGQTRIVLGSEWGSSLSIIMRESNKRIKLHGEDSFCRDKNRGLVGDFCKCIEIV